MFLVFSPCFSTSNSIILSHLGMVTSMILESLSLLLRSLVKLSIVFDDGSVCDKFILAPGCTIR